MTSPTPPAALLVAAFDRETAAQVRKACELFRGWARVHHVPLAPALRILEAQCAAVSRNGAPITADGPGGGHDVPSQQRLTVGVREAADMLGLSVRTVQTHVGTGALRSSKVGGRRLITLAALEDFIDDRADT